MTQRGHRIETDLIHAGRATPRIAGAVATPVFQSSIYEYGADERELRYIRLSNSPNHVVLHERLATLEGGEAALVTSSGMAAISATLLSVLSHGDHVILHRTLYGGTHGLVTRDFAAMGISHTFVDANDASTWQAALRPTTRAFYVETITNPLLEVVDLDGVAAFSRSRGLVSIIDNTCATPVNYRPLARGFDLVVHSATKYLNGHSDIVAGAVVGSRARVDAVRRKLEHLGGVLDPHACFLLERGMKTLALRVRHQNDSAARIARFLQSRPEVARVHYPALEGHAGHARAREWFLGAGGLLSFELGAGLDAALRFLSRLKLVTVAPSLGGVETLATMPATTSHRGLPADERRALGIADGLLRISAGLEHPEDVIADLAYALGASDGSGPA